MIRLLIVDDQRLVRAGVRMLCESTTDVEVVGEGADGVEAVRLTAELRPDVVLMDLRMPGLDGTAATAQITASCPDSKVLVLTTFDDDEHLYPALSAGAAGFLLKDSDPVEMLTAIRRVADGDILLAPSVLRRIVDRAVSAAPAAGTNTAGRASLTARERDVLALVADGLSNQEIAERLHLGVTTVKTHVANLMDKTSSPNRVRLAVFAVRDGHTP